MLYYVFRLSEQWEKAIDEQPHVSTVEAKAKDGSGLGDTIDEWIVHGHGVMDAGKGSCALSVSYTVGAGPKGARRRMSTLAMSLPQPSDIDPHMGFG